jgi:hypothetical protein
MTGQLDGHKSSGGESSPTTTVPRPNPACDSVSDSGADSGSDSGSETVAQILSAQAALLEQWISSPEALTVATHIVRKRSLTYCPDELIHEAWLRLQRSMAARSEPLPEMNDLTSAARYCARVLDNLSRDWIRTNRRRRELSVASFHEANELDPQSSRRDLVDPTDPHLIVETRLLLEQLIHKVADRAEKGLRCGTCPAEVVTATAIEILQMALAGIQPGDQGREWIDQLMYTALDRVSPEPLSTEAARTQRKSRCGRCVMNLLNQSMRDMGAGDLQ